MKQMWVVTMSEVAKSGLGAWGTWGMLLFRLLEAFNKFQVSDVRITFPSQTGDTTSSVRNDIGWLVRKCPHPGFQSLKILGRHQNWAGSRNFRLNKSSLRFIHDLLFQSPKSKVSLWPNRNSLYSFSFYGCKCTHSGSLVVLAPQRQNGKLSNAGRGQQDAPCPPLSLQTGAIQ